ncbi:MAG: hydroxylamine reductase, partial [Syntrophales bacterium]|nr:hydroxylamine reductase [Syntrophales bacterium]
MFCYQCEQTARGEGCGKSGVCGKQPDVAALQDLLLYALTGMAQAAVAAQRVGIRDRAADLFVCEALFTTVTNVDFDPERLAPLIRRAAALRDALFEKLRAAGAAADFPDAAATFSP